MPTATVATLGTPAAGEYPIRFCTDAVTSSGTGGMVYWNGSVWKTYENVIATTDIYRWFIDAHRIMLLANSARGWVEASYYSYPISASFGRITAVSGTGAGLSSNTGTNGPWAQWTSGTDATGHVRAYAGGVRSDGMLGIYAVGAVLYHNAAATVGDVHWWVYGAGSNSGAGNETEGVYLLYDPFVVTGHTITGADTNNILLVTANDSSYTYTSTGVSPPTTQGSAISCLLIFTETNAVAVINGNFVATNTSNIPAGSGIFCPKLSVTKTSGASAKILNEARSFRAGLLR